MTRTTTSTTTVPTTRPCRACKGGYVTGPAGLRRPCISCKGTGRL